MSVIEDPVQAISELQPNEVAAFLRERIRDKSLTTIVKELNAQVLSSDQARRQSAKDALRTIGFL